MILLRRRFWRALFLLPLLVWLHNQRPKSVSACPLLASENLFSELCASWSLKRSFILVIDSGCPQIWNNLRMPLLPTKPHWYETKRKHVNINSIVNFQCHFIYICQYQNSTSDMSLFHHWFFNVYCVTPKWSNLYCIG